MKADLDAGMVEAGMIEGNLEKQAFDLGGAALSALRWTANPAEGFSRSGMLSSAGSDRHGSVE
ncbi:MAG: hypothetical protein WCD47_22410 [Candidatus Sulfotelmatobacter sp.]